MSTFGIAAIILYAPSGVIADKFSHRKMITSAIIITGLLGLLAPTAVGNDSASLKTVIII